MHFRLKQCIRISLLTVLGGLSNDTKGAGVDAGVSLGITGYTTDLPFKSIEELRDGTALNNANLKQSFSTYGGQVGLFAKLDLGGIYVKPDLLYALDWIKYTKGSSKTQHSIHGVTVPVQCGLSLFGILRPHTGLIFRIPFGNINQNNTIKQSLYRIYKHNLSGILLGIGLDFFNFLADLDFEVSFSATPQKSFENLVSNQTESPSINDANVQFRLNKFSLRVGYNLLALANLGKGNKG